MINIVVVVLVVVVLVLCAGVFMLYNQEKAANNDATSAKQSYDTLNASYGELSGKYTALVANNADLSERYDTLDDDYKNITSNYASLKNQSDTTTVKLSEFLEADPTVAYTYRISSETGSNNTTMLRLKVDVYNVGKSDARNVVVTTMISRLEDNMTSELTEPIVLIPSLGKRSVVWDLNNTSRVQSVWVRLA